MADQRGQVTSLSKDLYQRLVRPEATDHQVWNVAPLAGVAGGGRWRRARAPAADAATGTRHLLRPAHGRPVMPIVGGLDVRGASRVHAFSAIIAGVTTLMVFRTVLVVTSLRLDSTLWGVSPPLLRPSH